MCHESTNSIIEVKELKDNEEDVIAAGGGRHACFDLSDSRKQRRSCRDDHLSRRPVCVG
jgi:hypothetical protein